MRHLPLLVLTCAALLLAACGGDKQIPATPKPAGQDLSAIKTYLLDHTKRLQADVVKLRANAEAYHKLAASTGFDDKTLLAEHRTEAARLMTEAKAVYIDSNPAYEEMEAVVAGVPALADYDVIIDPGGDASDPKTAVPFSIKTEDGRTFKQPGNLFFLVESSLYGTEPKFAAKADLDGDGTVKFGEALPDARFYLAALKEFDRQATELDAAAKKWTPSEQDALTALVVMTRRCRSTSRRGRTRASWPAARRRRSRSSAPRASRTSPTSSAAWS